MAELKLLVFSFTIPLLLLLLACIFRRRRILASICFATGFLWIYLPSTPLVAYKLAESWQTVPAFSEQQAQASAPQAVVILSGDFNTHIIEYPAEYTLGRATLIRLRYGARMAKHLQLPVMTNGSILDAEQPISLADAMAKVLQDEYGVPTRWREDKSHTTAQNAKYSAELLSKENIQSIVLVTDAIHMPRAVLAFERYGFLVTPAPTMFDINRTKNLLFRLIPRAWTFTLTKRVLHEALGYWVYKHFTLPKAKLS